MQEPLLVRKDSHGRVALGAVLTEDRYLVTRDSRGRVILEPVVVLSGTETELLRSRKFREKMTAAAGEPTFPLDLDEI